MLTEHKKFKKEKLNNKKSAREKIIKPIIEPNKLKKKGKFLTKGVNNSISVKETFPGKKNKASARKEKPKLLLFKRPLKLYD